MNYAFIDGQNLYLGTRESGWKVDYQRFYTYLTDKYSVDEAYYFLGVYLDEHLLIYESLERAGFLLIFREHSADMKGVKKGNVDTDIVFEIMKKLVEMNLDKAFIVSGDGDYKRLVNYLIEKHKFGKILFPNKRFTSSLYNDLAVEHVNHLENEEVRAKIARTSS